MHYTVKWTIMSRSGRERMTVHTYYGLTHSEALHQASVCAKEVEHLSKEWDTSISIFAEED